MMLRRRFFLGFRSLAGFLGRSRFFGLFLQVMRFDMVIEVLFVLENFFTSFTTENLSVLVPLFVPLPELDSVEHDVAK